MTAITLNRGEACAIPFVITDAANGLLNKRISWTLAKAPGLARVLRKVSNLPGSTADVTITTQLAGSATGFINIIAADFDILTKSKYYATLWIDDGVGGDRCVTAGGTDLVTILNDVSRS